MAIPPRRTHTLKRWIQTPPGVHQDANNNPAPRDINPPPLGEVHHSKMTTQICAKLPESSHPANCRQVQLTHDYTSLGTANLVSCALNRMFSLLTESLPYQSNVVFFFHGVFIKSQICSCSVAWWVSHNILLTKHRSACHSNAIWDLVWGPEVLLVIQNRFLHKDHEANKRSQWSDENQSRHPPAQPTSADMSVRLVWTGKLVCCLFCFLIHQVSQHINKAATYFSSY